MTQDWDDQTDPEDPDESDMDSTDEPDLGACPFCRKLISEDTEQCPHCGRHITPPHHLSKPVWVMIVAIVLILLMVLFVAL